MSPLKSYFLKSAISSHDVLKTSHSKIHVTVKYSSELQGCTFGYIIRAMMLLGIQTVLLMSVHYFEMCCCKKRYISLLLMLLIHDYR